MFGALDKLFDINGDGHLSSLEQGVEFMTFQQITDDLSQSSQEQQIADAGIDLADLEMMDTGERREALEDAGLDPDDFDDVAW